MNSLLNWVFPRICLYCHQIIEQGFICPPCHEMLPWPQKSCLTCAQHQGDLAPPICLICQQKPPPYHRLYALFDYACPIDVFIQRLKFQEKFQYAEFFAQEFIKKIPLWYEQDVLPQALLPVPLSLGRLRERGFNQSVCLAKPLAKKLQLPLLIRQCKRIKATQAQTLLKGRQQQNNLKNAFKLCQPIEEKHIAIIDDVVTSGKTLLSLLEALRNTNIARIDVWCCARTQIKKDFILK